MKVTKGPGSIQFLEGPFKGPLAVFFVGMKNLRQIEFAVPKYVKKVDQIYSKPEHEWSERLAGFRRTFVDPVIESFALKVIGKIDVRSRYVVSGTVLIVFVPFLPQDCESPDMAQRMIAMLKEGVAQYYDLGARIFVLGGHTSGANAATELFEAFKERDILISHGGYATAVFNKHAIRNIFGRSHLREYAKDKKENEASVLTVVGGGAVGRPTVQANARLFDKTFVVARNEGRLSNAVEELRESTGLDDRRIIGLTSDKINLALAAADIIVLATNAQDHKQLQINPGIFADGKHRAICDATEPTNLAREIVRLQEVTAFDGGIIRLNQLSKVDPCFRMVFGGTSNKHIFACSAEAVMWLFDIRGKSVREHFVEHNLKRKLLTGPTHDSMMLNYIERRFKRYGLKLASFQREGVILSREELRKLQRVGQRSQSISATIYELMTQLVRAH